MRPNRLECDRAMVMIIDLQEKLIPAMVAPGRLIRRCAQLVRGAGLFSIPTLVTEQYVRGLGPTNPEIGLLARQIGASFVEKSTFSACGSVEVRRVLSAWDRPQVLLGGIEAHICVLQTALDLRVMGYDVFVCPDASSSRRSGDSDVAWDRLRSEGVIVTTVESALFELCERCDAPAFQEMLGIIRQFDASEAAGSAPI